MCTLRDVERRCREKVTVSMILLDDHENLLEIQSRVCKLKLE
jgi:hypothetical protein